ncbi:MAG: glycosyltransferase family 39 protein [Candidatus Omnitrophota bacterium]|nr:glycosyltransferase family 39 protein [Candidatus Omnitrophota bacterium]
MKYFKFILVFFFIYLILVFPHIWKPLVADDIYFANSAKVPLSISDFGPRLHPPLYLHILRFFSQLFGVFDNGLRIIGIICFLLNLILIYKLSQQAFHNERVGFLACLIFALHPMAIQGSMILDIDNTVLTVVLMLTVFYFSKNMYSLNFKTGFFLTLLFFCSLWAKFTTPFILMGSMLLFFIFKKDTKNALKIFIISLSSILVFLLMWRIYSRIFNFPFSGGIITHLLIIRKFIRGVSFGPIQEFSLRILRVSLWFGIYIILFWIAIILRRIKVIGLKNKELNSNDFLIIYSICIFMGYTLIGGLFFGFAKYQYPMLPIISIIIANAILSFDLKSFKNNFFIYIIAAIILVFLNNFILPDPIYQINYTLRKLSIFATSPISSFIKTFSLQIIFCFLLLFLFVEISRRIIRESSFWQTFCFLLATFILINNFYTNIYLRKVDFFTTLCYGRDIREFKRVANLCKEIAVKNKDKRIIAPEDILYYADIKVFQGYEKFWNRRDKFLRLIEKDKVDTIIYAFTYNPIFSYKNIFLDPSVFSQLKEKYTFTELKEHTIWQRK